MTEAGRVPVPNEWHELYRSDRQRLVSALMAAPDAVRLARAVRRRVVENFSFSALYNLIAAPAAMLGLVNPFVAAIAMSGSSLVVILNALRLGLGERR